MPPTGGTGRFLRGLVTADEVEARVFECWRGFTWRGRSTRSSVSRTDVHGRWVELGLSGLGRGVEVLRPVGFGL